MIAFRRVPSPLGEILVAGPGHEVPGGDGLDGDQTITALRLPDDRGDPAPDPSWREAPHAFARAAAQIADYFAGARRGFDLPLAPAGTAFQLRVWAALRDIPQGRTASYADIARAIGQPKATRAVGGANGRNPIPLLIPCHRVVAADGSLGGFSGSLAVKRALLEREGAWEARLV